MPWARGNWCARPRPPWASSYGDFVAVSAPVDGELADMLARLVCNGIIAPGYEPGTVARLSTKQGGRFLILQADAGFQPPPHETREIYGLRLTQPRDDVALSAELLASPVRGDLPPNRAVDDLLLGLAVARYTQSNSVAYLRQGMALGIGAGQQSRVDCTRLAGAKLDTWWLRRHPLIHARAQRPEAKIQDRIAAQLGAVELLGSHERDQWIDQLDDVAFVSDGYLPFSDNIDHARRHGVRYIAEPGGSARSGDIQNACHRHGITLVYTDLRLFRH